MKKRSVLVLMILISSFVYASDFVFPPELKWWLQEIQSQNVKINLDDFKFQDKRVIEYGKSKLSFKGKLYPVFKKWNYYGNQFAYNDVYVFLTKNSNGKYFVSSDIDSTFGVFNKNEEVVFLDTIGGSTSWINSFCWVKDDYIVAVGVSIIDWNDEKDFLDIDFTITEYYLEKKQVVKKEYFCNRKVTKFDLNKLSWIYQRADYFELTK